MFSGSHKSGAASAAPILALLLCLLGQQAVAASMNVNPVRLTLQKPGQSTELRIRNDGLEPISVEVTSWAWSQSEAGEDRLEPTDQILAVPPIFTLQAGKQQIVRVAFLGNAHSESERTFRLLATELAPPSGPQGSAVSMRVQLSLPIFVTAPGTSPKPEIQLVSTSTTREGTVVTLRNSGNAHVKLRTLEVIGSQGTLPARGDRPVGQARYLLPGTTMEFLIPGDAGTLQGVRITPEKGKGWEHAVATPE